MLNIQTAAISKTEIDALVDQNVQESKQLEFKRQLPPRDHAGKKEFLADVSSFANASGGDIVFGISEQDAGNNNKGCAASVVPLPADQVDSAKLWIEEVVRTGIAPRLQIEVQEVTGFGDSGTDCVIIVRIPKSFAAPHVVSLKGGFRFFSRNSAGKYPLDIAELRSHFLASQSQAARIREFRQERIGRILAGETPMPLSSSMLAVLHVIPLNAFLNDTKQSLSSLQYSLEFGPFGNAGVSRFNLDGRITYCENGSQTASIDSYCQLFFNGVAESVDADLILGPTTRDSSDFVGHINSGRVESQILEAVSQYSKSYKKMGISGQLAVSFALVNCKGIAARLM